MSNLIRRLNLSVTWPNWLMCLTNATCYWPLILTYTKKDWVTFSVILFVYIMTVITDLFETNKHGLQGIIAPMNPKINYALSRLNLLGLVFFLCRFMELYAKTYGASFPCDTMYPNLYLAFCAFSALCIASEDRDNPKLKPTYLLFLSVWRLSIYPIMYYFLKKFIYFM